MTVTPTLITDLRELIAEEIPSGGTEADTRFSNARLTVRLEAAYSIEEAAAECWDIKAGKFQAEIGKFKSVGSGQEAAQWYSPQEQLEYCQKMARMYREKSEGRSFGVAVAAVQVIDDLDY